MSASGFSRASDLGYIRGLAWAQKQIEVTARDCGLPLDSPAADVLRELARRFAVKLDQVQADGYRPAQSLRSKAFAITCPACGAVAGFACIGLHNGLHKERKDAART